MGRLFLIEYDQTPDTSFFVCSTCRAHIALAEEYVTRTSGGGIFCNAVNLVIDGPEHERVAFTHRVVNVHCVRCMNCLGWKYVRVGENAVAVREGRYLLHLSKLYLWTGDSMVNADTTDPVDD